MMPVIRAKHRVEDGEDADDVSAFDVSIGRFEVLGKGSVDCICAHDHLSLQAVEGFYRDGMFSRRFLNSSSPFKQKVRHVRRSTPIAWLIIVSGVRRLRFHVFCVVSEQVGMVRKRSVDNLGLFFQIETRDGVVGRQQVQVDPGIRLRKAEVVSSPTEQADT